MRGKGEGRKELPGTGDEIYAVTVEFFLVVLEG